MAALTGRGAERARAVSALLGWSLVVLVSALLAGYGFASLARPAAGSRMLPWIAASSLGLAAYVTMLALVALGIWLRHPWRFRYPVFSPEARLRAHAALAAATLALVVGHLSAVALDRYAGVGWLGALVPGQSHYRTVPVSLGVLAFFGLLLVSVTAGVAGRLTGRRWLSVHRLALPLFAVVWLHGVLAGSDTGVLRTAYAVSGTGVVVLAASRYLAAPR